MRILLALGWYFPESIGGTEMYVRGLAGRLQQRGVEVTIAAPWDRGDTAEYIHEKIRVLRYPAPSSGRVGSDSADGILPWETILETIDPQLVDFHSLTTGLSVHHVRAVKKRRAAIVLTVHVPLVCQRGTLLRFGKVPCDGDLAHRPCVECRLEARGVPRPIGALAARVPSILRRTLQSFPLPRPAKALLNAQDRANEHRQRLEEVFQRADRIVAVSRWLGDTLLRNGLPAHKLAVCPQGVEAAQGDKVPETRQAAPVPGRLQVGFIGRYDWVKGLHVLIDAVRLLPEDVPLHCHVWGIAASEEAQAYKRKVLRQASGDSRIFFHSPADASGILPGIDVLAVPSIWMETGPLVLLEAFAAGVPVVGSDLGGIAEKVRHGIDGWLVPPNNPGELASALLTLACDPARVTSLRSGIPAVRRLDDVVDQTQAIYSSLLS